MSDSQLTDIEKVAGLRGLIEVELMSARGQVLDPHGDGNYARGRLASYEFVVEAIDRRWPDLEHDAREDRSEIIRHHDAFLAIRAVIDAGLSGSVDALSALRDIQQLVG